MSTGELLKALAYLTALERYSDAQDAAERLPEWLEVIDLIRAGDGVEQLARALDARRRRGTAA